MKGSDLFIKALEQEGVEYIFGIPGEENLDFLDSLSNSSIKLIITRHEQAAGFMAATYGRLTGEVGVCLSTLGPGATNFVTAAAYAELAAMPMLMITGQKPILKSKQGLFQIINAVDMMRPLTKFTKQIVTSDNIPCTIRKAFRIATRERPGAVHIELPEDIAAEQTNVPLFTKTQVEEPTASEAVIKQAVELIQASRRPLLLIGAGANRKRITQELRKFIDTSGMYFFNTQMGKGVLDERDPLFLGTAALSENDYLHCALARADLIINVGHDVVEKPPFFMEHDSTQKVIHLNYYPAKIDDVYFPNQEVVGDIAHSLSMLSFHINKQPHWDNDYFNRIKQEVETNISKESDSKQFPLLPQRLVNDVRSAVPENGIITLDNGMYKIWFARNYKAYQPNTVLLDNALATMGAGLPSAIAAKLVNPDRKVVSICGDGGFMMNSQEIETAVRLKLDLVVVIINDSGYGMIKWKQAAMKFKDYGLDFKNPDFVAYAKAYGAQGHRIEKTEDFAKKLKKCINSKGVHLIDVPVDYSQNIKVLIDELYQKTCLL